MEHAATAIDKAMDVLFHLHEQPEAQGVSDIGRALALPRSSAHRLLSALRRRGLVEQDERGRYRPGVALLALGLGVLEREPLVVAGRPVLERHAAELGETFFLVGARGGELVVLDKVEGTGFLRASPRVGSAVPVHATAVGKLYLAHAPDRVQAGTAERFTARTLDEGRLSREVAKARRDGYAENRGEWIDGLSVMAAPVFLGESLLGAVCTAFAQRRIEQLDARAVVKRVKTAADEIGARLSGGSHEGLDRRPAV